MNGTELTVEINVNFQPDRRGRKKAVLGKPAKPPVLKPGSIPRVTRLMALAIRFEKLIRDGEIGDFAEIARLAHVTRARVTQIMNLLLLAPDIQDAILHLPEPHRAGIPSRSGTCGLSPRSSIGESSGLFGQRSVLLHNLWIDVAGI